MLLLFNKDRLLIRLALPGELRRLLTTLVNISSQTLDRFELKLALYQQDDFWIETI